MKTKLTLYMDEELVKRAKHYAKKQRKSLSSVITDLLQKQTKTSENQQSNDNPFRQLAGLLDYEEVKRIKDDRVQYLLSKHD